MTSSIPAIEDGWRKHSHILLRFDSQYLQFVSQFGLFCYVTHTIYGRCIELVNDHLRGILEIHLQLAEQKHTNLNIYPSEDAHEWRQT
jgi:hypothetical protein